MMGKVKCKLGDIFSVPLSSEIFSVGQVIATPEVDSITVIVFKKTFSFIDSINIESLLDSDILLFANTFDAKLYHNDWRIITNSILPSSLVFPYYKLGTRDEARLVDFLGNEIRKLTSEQFDLFAYQKHVAPIRVENAAKALNGLGVWEKDKFEPLMYGSVIKSINNATTLPVL